MSSHVSVTNAKTVFLPFPGSLDSLRRSAVQALLSDAPASRFTITHENDYLPGILDSILCDADQLETLLTELREKVNGSDNGAYRCAALWDWDRNSGLLIHQEKENVLCAFLPLVTKTQAQLEKQLALNLSRLAIRAGDTMIDLGRKPPTGKRKLADMLRYLAKQIDPG